jgi:hypothetical protein
MGTQTPYRRLLILDQNGFTSSPIVPHKGGMSMLVIGVVETFVLMEGLSTIACG